MRKTLIVLSAVFMLCCGFLSFIATKAAFNSESIAKLAQSGVEWLDNLDKKRQEQFIDLYMKVNSIEKSNKTYCNLDLTGQSYNSISSHGIVIILLCDSVKKHAKGSELRIIGVNTSALRISKIAFKSEYKSKSGKTLEFEKDFAGTVDPGAYFANKIILADIYPDDLDTVTIQNLQISIGFPAFDNKS